ncbi:MAG TPA: hypothetical protein PK926_05370 [Spirochaetota bacterium]|nr:hypothetical protein [Spirochaetota bacterium]HPI89284.1 hypothetical protein [Spirochaetota bacterium]HPR48556.1 hypothetical protein [Spirochaetota bacterium]
MNHPVNENNRGLVDMTNRILKVLLNRPSFKNNVRQVLNNIDAGAAPELARTLLWQDMEFMFGLVGALPAIANTFILLADEIVNQVRDKITPELLRGFIETLARDIDIERAMQVKQNLLEIWQEVEPVLSSVTAASREVHKQKSNDTPR